ncbi:MAG: hydrogenase nickel incorporation protein HypB [bacterium]|nr:hydrogenase nickel incorporation protein HypB [bacterium]
MEIKVMEKVIEANKNKSNEIRNLLNQKNILMLNLISSPGSGKTSLLEQTIPVLQDKYRIAVIEGDITTDKDAKRLNKFGIPVVLINTNGGCHLNSASIAKALTELDLNNLDLIFVENVGNLVCPSEFNLGEDTKVAIVSTPEGEDKPAKYPMLFRNAEIAVLNKIDLIDILNFNTDDFYADLQKLNAGLTIVEVSCTRKKGIKKWLSWVEKKLSIKKESEVINER